MNGLKSIGFLSFVLALVLVSFACEKADVKDDAKADVKGDAKAKVNVKVKAKLNV